MQFIVSSKYIILAAVFFLIKVEFIKGKQDVRDSKQSTKRISPSIRAVLLECPKGANVNSCEKKMMVNIRVSPSFHLEKLEKYLILDELYDTAKRSKAKLLSPYLIEIYRGEPVLMYPLEFSKSIRCPNCQNKSESKSGSENSENIENSGNCRLVEKNFDINSEIEEPEKVLYSKGRESANMNKFSNSYNEPVVEVKDHLTDDNSSTGKNNGDLEQKSFMDEYANLKSTIFNDKNYNEEQRYRNEMDKLGRQIPYINPASSDVSINENDNIDMRHGQEKKLFEVPVASYDIDEKLFEELEKQSKFFKSSTEDADKELKVNEKKNILYKPIGQSRDIHTINNKFVKQTDKIKNNDIYIDGKGEFPISPNQRTSKSENNGQSKILWTNILPIPDDDSSEFDLDGYQNEQQKKHQRPNTNYNDKSLNNPTKNNNIKEEQEILLFYDKTKPYKMSLSSASAREKNCEINQKKFKNIHNDKESAATFHDFSSISPQFKIFDKRWPSKEAKDVDTVITQLEGVLENRLPKSQIISGKIDRDLKKTNLFSENARLRKGYIEPLPLSDYLFAKSKVNNFEDLLSETPPAYLPKEGPFQEIMNDPNLNIDDKIDLLEVIDPTNDKLDKMNEMLTNEIFNSHIPYDFTKNDRMPLVKGELSKSNITFPRLKKFNKRSYMFYDDLKLRDSYDDYEELNIPYFENNDLYSISKKMKKCPCQLERNTDSHDKNYQPFCETCGRSKNNQGKNPKITGENDNLCVECGQNPCECVQNEVVEDLNPRKSKQQRSIADTWYSVYNMTAPLQFLVTRVRIFRKKENTWWRIAPSITLTSLSGIYANSNLSIIFSSHVDIYQLEKPLLLKNHKLLVPKEDQKLKSPKDLLAFSENKFSIDGEHQDIPQSITSLCNAAFQQSDESIKSKRSDQGIFSLGDFGYFPTEMNILEKCKNDQSHLCLNILDEEVPGYSIKIQLPFRENALMPDDFYKVRITNIITDATSWGALQVTVNVVNEGFISHEFSICICNCPVTCGSQTVVKRLLLPHIGDMVTFLLPLQENKPKKYYCYVDVKSDKGKIIAKRKMIIEPTMRCFCIWQCNCYCIPNLMSSSDIKVCQFLDKSAEKEAGFDINVRNDYSLPVVVLIISGLLITIAIVFGVLKALFGLLFRNIDEYGYNYVQPMNRYEYSTRSRRFFINSIFFVVVPFIFCCTCFMPSDEDLLISTTNWGYLIEQQELDDESDDEEDGEYNHFVSDDDHNTSKKRYIQSSDDDEETILSQRIEKCHEEALKTGEDSPGSLDNEHFRRSRFLNRYYVNTALTRNETYNQNLKDGHSTEELNESDPEDREAAAFVKSLIFGKIVYRKFSRPIGGVQISEGQSYSIRGYFLADAGKGYIFIAPIPIRQYFKICSEPFSIEALDTPILLNSNDFIRSYCSRKEVLNATDLSTTTPIDAPCINVKTEEFSRNKIGKN